MPCTSRTPPGAPYLTQAAIRLSRLCKKHFHIETKDGLPRVVADVRPSDVVAFLAEYTAAIRPLGLSADKAIPGPDERLLRVFLWSRPLADEVLNDVVRLSLYADQIVIPDPFSKFASSRPFTPGPEGPHAHPDRFVQQFANWGLLVCALEDWFEADLAVLLPDPETFGPPHPPFDRLGADALQAGLFSLRPDADSIQDMLEAAAITTRGGEDLRALIALILTEASPPDREEVALALEAFLRATPTRHVPAAPEHASLIVHGSGYNVFKAAWTADRLGGYIVPGGAHDRNVFRRVSRGTPSADSTDALVTAFAVADLPMLNNVTLDTALELRKSGRLAPFRAFLQETWVATSDPGTELKAIEHEHRLAHELQARYAEAKDEWRAIYRDLGVKGAASLFAAPLAEIIHGGIGLAIAGATSWLYRGWSGAARAFRRKPAALMVQLENETHPNPVRRAVASLERRL